MKNLIVPVNAVSDMMFRDALLHALDGVDRKVVFTTKDVPSTGKAIHEMYRSGGEFRVFSGSNDADNLYFSPMTNLYYRALHDVDHAVAYELGRGTTKYEDELYLNCLMAKRAYDYAVSRSTQESALRLFFEVYHDTVGQAVYYKKHNDFCVNQRENTLLELNACLGTKYLKRGDVRSASQVMLAYMTECGL